MQHPFDFNDIGRREPFTVPDGFFDSLNDRLNAIPSATTPRTVILRRRTAILSAAAAVALLVAISSALWLRPADPQPCAMTDVEGVFAHMSDADRSLVLETYNYDIFLTN